MLKTLMKTALAAAIATTALTGLAAAQELRAVTRGTTKKGAAWLTINNPKLLVRRSRSSAS